MSQFQKKSKFTQKSAKNINEAIEAALAELNASRDEVEIEVIEEGSKGFLGFGAKDAVVKVTVKTEEKSELKKPANRKEKRRAKFAKEAAKPAENVPAYDSSKSIGDYEIPSKDSDPITASEMFLKNLFASMQLDVKATASLEGDMLTVNLEGDNMGIIIGKRGDTLDSIQYLTSLVVNRRSDDYIKVTIDTENYREKRREALIALSDRLADKVIRSGRKFTLEPMNPYERRIIHANLQDNEAVSTFSVGSEPYRKVVIAPKNAKPRYERHQKPAAPRKEEEKPAYTATYKADFKATPHKAEYKNYEEYLKAQNGEIVPPINYDSEEEN